MGPYHQDLKVIMLIWQFLQRMQICSACLSAFLGDIVLKGKAGIPFMGYSIPNPIQSY